MSKRYVSIAVAATIFIGWVTGAATAQDAIKIGMSFAMTGAGFNAAGRQAAAGARLYVQQHGETVAGKKIELILRDDAGVADNARRLVQEMIVNDKVNIIAGGITPTVLAYSQLVNQAKIPTVVMFRALLSRLPHHPITCAPALSFRNRRGSWESGQPRTAANV